MKWRPIYEVTDTSFFAAAFFQTQFLDQCKKNPNKPQNLISEVKVALKKMDLEHGLYAKVVMICRNDSDNKKEKEKEKNKKYIFQGKFARLTCWFGLGRKWLEENFITCEPGFYKTLSN